MLKTFLISVTSLLLLTSCTKDHQILAKYNFDSNNYVLYGIQAEGTPTKFVQEHPNFKVTDIKTLNDFKDEWRLSPSPNSWACGLNYSLYLMRGDSCIDKFYVNLECEFLNHSNGSFIFPENFLADHKSSIINIPSDSAKLIQNKILKRK